MDSLLFSINAVVPIFLIMLVGIVLRKVGMLNDDYVKRSSVLVFRVSLPLLVFIKIGTTNLRGLDLGLPVALFVGVSIAVFFAAWLCAHFMMKHPPSRGAFVQGSFRGNIAIIALSILANIVSDNGITTALILLAAAMIFYNVLAVIVLSVTGHDRAISGRWHVVLSIVRNPLIIAVLIALLFSLCNWQLPEMALKAATSLAQLAFPLALLGIGASMQRAKLVARALPVMLAAVIKNIVLPLAVCVPAYYCGIRGETLAVLFVVSGTPTAVASFIMAKAMNSDADLAAGIIVGSTLLSLPCLSVGIAVLRALGMV